MATKKKSTAEQTPAEQQQPEQSQPEQEQASEDQGPEGADSLATTAETNDAVLTSETGDAAAPSPVSPEVASLTIVPSQVRTLDPRGNCGHCHNPHIAKYGEGKWSCVCGAGNR